MEGLGIPYEYLPRNHKQQRIHHDGVEESYLVA